MMFPGEEKVIIFGSGYVRNGITDIRDVGRYVARIIDDERTLDKFVCFFGETPTQEKTFKLVEELSGESIARKYVSFLVYLAKRYEVLITTQGI